MYKIAICDDNLFFIKQLRTMLKEKIRSDDQIEIYEYHSGEQLLMEMDHFFDVIFMYVVLVPYCRQRRHFRYSHIDIC